jgi:hypothetical protein
VRRILLLLVVAAAVAALAVVSFRHSGSSLDPVASAATKTASAGGYHIDMNATFAAARHQFSMTGTGVADSATNSADITFTFNGLPAAMTQHGSSAEMIETGQTLYMKFDFAQGKLPNGKSWMKLDLGRAEKALGFGSQAPTSYDPSQYLDALRADADVQQVGTDTVQGEQMTHYHANIDVARLAHVPAAARARVQSLLKQVGMQTLPVDVWVDSNGYVRRETMAVHAAKMSMSLTADLSAFGSQVTVTPPPASQVFDATSAALKATR